MKFSALLIRVAFLGVSVFLGLAMARPPEPSLPQNPQFVQQIDYQSIRKTIKNAIQSKQFEKAFILLHSVPSENQTSIEKDQTRVLGIVDQIEKEAQVTENLSFEEIMNTNVELSKRLKQYYSEAVYALLNSNSELAKTILRQMVFYQKVNFRARQLLKVFFDTEIIPQFYSENMIKTYLDQSLVYFYAGNYAKAIEDLMVLTVLDPQNPLVFKRLGSAYYMVGKKQKAIDYWNVALYFNQDDSELTQSIAKVKKMLMGQVKADAKSNIGFDQQQKGIDFQTMGVFSTSEKAYQYANELRQSGFSVIVNKTKQKSWEVQVPREELLKKDD